MNFELRISNLRSFQNRKNEQGSWFFFHAVRQILIRKMVNRTKTNIEAKILLPEVSCMCTSCQFFKPPTVFKTSHSKRKQGTMTKQEVSLNIEVKSTNFCYLYLAH